ncbi:MerR family transcriptional regulator [Neobacillus sp. SM06]|uniref:MerR family transcriptional regulator n=1 Tax=Neobacillus sp. SM06 TaxID=3422492 RepID=UPI003D2E4253
MEYTVQKLAELAGVSARTIRYYDEIGILKPAEISSSGYRKYGREEVEILQQILFYRELGDSLEKIKLIITSPTFDALAALKTHHDQLLEKRKQLDLLIANVKKTIASAERGIKMTDQEKFEGFKTKLIEENEKNYGEEVRKKFGDQAVDRSNQKIKGITQEQYEVVTKLADEILETLYAAYQTGDPSSDLAQKTADLHRQWLSFYWDVYTKEAHVGIVQMYVSDERFKDYYDKGQPGAAEFLRDAVLTYTGMNI